MKKILTLLLAAGAFVSVQAQSREDARRVILGDRNGTYEGRNDRDVILGGGNNGGQYPGDYSRDRQNQIDQINREYDNKIYSIRNNPNLSNYEKERAIRQLENDRQRRVAEINRRYSNRDRDYDNDDRYDDRDERYNKKNRGNKKGWEIGRGNPHRNGGKDWKQNGNGKKNKNKNWKD